MLLVLHTLVTMNATQQATLIHNTKMEQTRSISQAKANAEVAQTRWEHENMQNQPYLMQAGQAQAKHEVKTTKPCFYCGGGL